MDDTVQGLMEVNFLCQLDQLVLQEVHCGRLYALMLPTRGVNHVSRSCQPFAQR